MHCVGIRLLETSDEEGGGFSSAEGCNAIEDVRLQSFSGKRVGLDYQREPLKSCQRGVHGLHKAIVSLAAELLRQ